MSCSTLVPVLQTLTCCVQVIRKLPLVDDVRVRGGNAQEAIHIGTIKVSLFKIGRWGGVDWNFSDLWVIDKFNETQKWVTTPKDCEFVFKSSSSWNDLLIVTPSIFR